MCKACPSPSKTDRKCSDCGGDIYRMPAEPADPECNLAALPAREECELCLLIVSEDLPRDEVRAVLDARMMAEH